MAALGMFLSSSFISSDKSCKDLLLNKSIIPIFIKILTKFPTHAKLAYTVVSALLVLSYERICSAYRVIL